DARYQMPDARYRMPDTRCRMPVKNNWRFNGDAHSKYNLRRQPSGITVAIRMIAVLRVLESALQELVQRRDLGQVILIHRMIPKKLNLKVRTLRKVMMNFSS
ncbi:hypothetical protein L0244_25095, partial [bacterium]|nr:hypothetical protein [bacterium]